MNTEKDCQIKPGEAVLIKTDAPKHFRPSNLGSVCGEWIVESAEYAKKIKVELGTKVLLIEFSDGVALDVPVKYIEVKKNNGVSRNS